MKSRSTAIAGMMLSFCSMLVNAEVDYPIYIGLKPLSDVNENTLLHGNCDRYSNDTLKCSFRKIFLFRKKSQLMDESKLDELISFFSELLEKPEAKESFGTNCTSFQELNQTITRAKDRYPEIIKMIDLMEEACREENKDLLLKTLRKLMKRGAELEEESCEISIYPYDLEFEKIGSGKDMVWRYQESASNDTCGTIKAVTLRPDGSLYEWIYDERHIVSFPEGSCKEQVRAPLVWSRSGLSVDIQCNGIDVR